MTIFAVRPKEAKLVGNEPLREYVQDRLAGRITDSDGAPVDGPEEAKWVSRNKPHRGDRRWVKGWSPEQISNRLKVDFPEDEPMRISHEAIYQALYIQGRGALKRELVTCLRTGRALRVPRERTRSATWAHVNDKVLISERTTRFTMLVHLPREEGYGQTPRVKNGPALSGYGAEAMSRALARTIPTYPSTSCAR